jgi:Ca-activated chloride channel family protein
MPQLDNRSVTGITTIRNAASQVVGGKQRELKPAFRPVVVYRCRLDRVLGYNLPTFGGVFPNRKIWKEAEMCKSTAVFVGVYLLAGWLAPAAWAQSDQVHFTPRELKAPHADAISDAGGIADPQLRAHTKPLRKDVDLVLVPVTVTDPMSRLVAGLEKDSFLLVENGQPQQIRSLSTEDAPISLGVIFDVSGSMADKIDEARQAVVEFFRTANPEDEFFLVTFSDHPQVLVDFTSSIDDIQRGLPGAIPQGATSLLDAIYLGISRMRQASHSRKALLIISDGGDNRSRYTEDQVADMVREADVQISAMGLFPSHPKTPEELHGPELLGAISGATGGQAFIIHSPRELPEVATKIGIQLRNQYLLGYRPTNPAHDGKWRKLRVKVKPPTGLPPLHVYARSGYYAATE